MTAACNAFAQLTEGILARYFAQNAQPVPPNAERSDFAARLWALVVERGLPRPLTAAERGTPGELPEVEVMALLDRALAGTSPDWRPALAGPGKQLVKACFYPEFKTCRDSYREVSPDGSCRRQELARARGRVSGVHCVDCPYWVTLAPEQHVRFLSRGWLPGTTPESGVDLFLAHREVFLPEDFRALRRLLHGLARTGI